MKPHVSRPGPDRGFWRSIRMTLAIEAVATVLVLLALFIVLPFVVLLLDAGINH